MVDSRVLVIGLDGANRQALLDGMNTGDLPTFADIASRGDIDTLEAPLPPTTPVSMSSILTGKDPDGHGIFSFEHDPRTGGGYVDADSIDGDTVFDTLSAAGGTGIAVNVPMTGPGSADVTVAGFPHTGGPVTDDPDLGSVLRTLGYRVEPTDFDGDRDAFIDDVFALAEKRFRAADHLIDRDWDLFFLMFTGDARLQHYVDDPEVVREFYRRVDDYLSRLLDRIDDEVTVLVVSDHGFRDVDAVVDIEAWLADQGRLTAAGSSDWIPLYGALDPDRYDWDATTAYPGAAYLGNLFVDGELDALRDDLLALEHDGDRVFRAVHRTTDLYGDCDGPDLVPVPRRRYNYVAGTGGPVVDTDPEERKVPDREGVVLCSDPDVAFDRPAATDIRPLLDGLLGT